MAGDGSPEVGRGAAPASAIRCRHGAGCPWLQAGRCFFSHEEGGPVPPLAGSHKYFQELAQTILPAAVGDIASELLGAKLPPSGEAIRCPRADAGGGPPGPGGLEARQPRPLCRFGSQCWRPWCASRHGGTAERAARLRGLAEWWARARDGLEDQAEGLGPPAPPSRYIDAELEDVLMGAPPESELDSSHDGRRRKGARRLAGRRRAQRRADRRSVLRAAGRLLKEAR
eukprot:8286842-Lingulodinium_polyedra.AAC.1